VHCGLDRHAVDNAHAQSAQAIDLGRVVGHQAHRADAQILQDAGGGGVVALIRLMAEGQIGLDRIVPLVLQVVGAQLVEQADAAPLLPQVDDHAAALAGNLAHGAVQLLTARCATPEIGRAMVREMAWYDRYLAAGGVDRSANPTPGNREGGLANIVEKTLGCIAKSGTSAISDVLSNGERVRCKGLVFAATPSGDFVCGTMQLAAGMTLHVFTTGRGTPYGLAAAPVIKMATRKDLSARWHDLIDIDAGRIATGERTIEEVGWELFRLVLDVASGRTKPWSERWGLDNGLALFNPTPLT